MVFHHFHHIRTSSHLRGSRSPAATAPSAESSSGRARRRYSRVRPQSRTVTMAPRRHRMEVEAASFLHIIYYVYIYMKTYIYITYIYIRIYIYISIYLGEKPVSPAKNGDLSSKNWPKKVEVPTKNLRWKRLDFTSKIWGKTKDEGPQEQTFQGKCLYNPPNQCFPGWCPSAKAEPQKTVLLVTLQGPVMQDRTRAEPSGWRLLKMWQDSTLYQHLKPMPCWVVRPFSMCPFFPIYRLTRWFTILRDEKG